MAELNILMILPGPLPPREGMAHHAAGLARRLRGRGHHVSFFIRGGSWRTERQEYDGFEVREIPFIPLRPLHMFFHGMRLRRAVASLSPPPDLLHVHSPLVPAPGTNLPLVVTFHSSAVADFSGRAADARAWLRKLLARTVSRKVERNLLASSAEIIVPSEHVRDALLREHGPLPNCHIIPNVVDPGFYSPGPGQAFAPNLLFVGRLDPLKGLAELVSSASEVVRAFPSVRYIVVGGGPFRRRLLGLIRKFRVEKAFEFPGEVRDQELIRRFYRQAWAVLIPSHAEGCPLVMLEALACGRPVIATDAGYARGWLEDGRNALLVEPGSAESLSRATIRLLEDSALREHLGREARRTALSKLDPEAHAARIEEVYLRVQAGR